MKKFLIITFLISLNNLMFSQTNLKTYDCYLEGTDINSFTKVVAPTIFQDANILFKTQTINIDVNYVGNWPGPAQSAFNHAVQIWKYLINSPVPITIEAEWKALGEESGPLAQTQTTSYKKNFSNVPAQDVNYPVSLAEALSETELNGSEEEIKIEVNSDMANNNKWYYGLDGNAPAEMYDLVSVILHEVAHGLGITHSFKVSNNLGSWGQGYANENDIWFSAFVRYDGENFIELPIPNILTGWRMNKIWGTSSEDLYVVGNNGNIAHYSGPTGGWQKIESGTDLHIYDIWGDYNDSSGDYEIIAVAANIAVNFDKKILKINSSNNVTLLSTSNIPFSLHGIWFKNKAYYVVGSGMYKKYDVTSSVGWEALHLGISNYYLDAICGNGLNDIIICGAFGELLHFNGVGWKNDYEEPNLGSGAYGSIKITGDLVIATGNNYSKAVILIGRR